MNVYLFKSSDHIDVVEAETIADALEIRAAHILREIPGEEIVDEPESITLIHDEPVIRAEPKAAAE